MRITVWVWLILVVWPGCQPAETKQVSRLTDEQLSRLFLDLQLSEVTLTGLAEGKTDSLRLMFQQRLSAIYNLSEEELKDEIRRLEADPEKMKMIMERAGVLADSIR